MHLGTSAARNVRSYQRLGSSVTTAVDRPDGGPRTWLMHRAPRPADADRRPRLHQALVHLEPA
ncbi:hypothetical protein [Blastococcus sp. SYSU DS0533]